MLQSVIDEANTSAPYYKPLTPHHLLCLALQLHLTWRLAFSSSPGPKAATNITISFEKPISCVSVTCTKSVAPMPERPPKRNLIPLGIVLGSAIPPLKMELKSSWYLNTRKGHLPMKLFHSPKYSWTLNQNILGR